MRAACYARTHHANRGVLSTSLSSAFIVQKENVQEKSPQEHVFGIDGVRDEIVGLAGRRHFLFIGQA